MNRKTDKALLAAIKDYLNSLSEEDLEAFLAIDLEAAVQPPEPDLSTVFAENHKCALH